MERDFTDDEMAFEWPRQVESLDAVPEIWRSSYFEATTGDGFVLHPEIEEEVAAGKRKVAEAEAEHQAKLAELEAESVRKEAKLRELVVGSDIRRALAEHGVAAGLMKGAEAYLRQHLAIEVVEHEDGGREAFVKDAYGEVSIDHAVRSWLQTPDGAAFMPEQPSPDAGRYSEAMRTLCATLH